MSNIITLGSRFRTIQSAVGQVPIDLGNVRTLELPRSFLFKTLFLRLTGSLNTTVAHTSIPAESPLQLLQKVEVIADGRKMIVSLAGRDLYRLAHIYRGKAGELLPPGTAIANPNSFSASIALDFEAARMAVPLDSYFDPRPFEKVELRITFGGIADITLGGTATLNTGGIVDVQLIQTTEGAPNVLFNRLQLFDEFTVASASTNFTMNVPRSGLLAGILLRATNQPGGGSVNVSNAVVNRLSLKSDNNFLHVDNVVGATLQTRNVLDAQLDSFLAAAGNMGQAIPGYYFLDLTEDGLISSALNTFDLNVLQLVADVNAPAGTNLLRASYVFFEPVAAR